MDREPIIILWLKKDLRATDHEALFQAVKISKKTGSKVLPIFIFEPSIESSPDFHPRHWKWIIESLKELGERLPIHVFYQESR